MWLWQSLIDIGIRAIFCQGLRWTICPRNSCKLPKFLRSSRKETMVIWCNNIGLHMKWKPVLHVYLSYELIKHVKRNSCLCHCDSQRQLWYDLYHSWLQGWHIPFVDKCNVTDVSLPHSVAEISFQPAQPTKWLFFRTWYHSGKLC